MVLIFTVQSTCDKHCISWLFVVLSTQCILNQTGRQTLVADQLCTLCIVHTHTHTHTHSSGD